MSFEPLHKTEVYPKLQQNARRLEESEFSLQHLLKADHRFDTHSRTLQSPGGKFFFDFSRQRLDDIVFSQLMDLADQSGALNLFAHMCKGFKVNTTESRPALHILSRLPSALADDSPLENKKSELNRVQDAISQYTRKVRDGRITGTTGKSFKHAVVVGIGGSYLGCEFVYTALRQGIKPEIALHFLSNVDIDNFQTVLDAIDPEETLWIIISKSYSTPETLANQAQVLELLDRKGLSPKDHLVTVTAKKDAAQGQTFFMFDYIGGRYSVSSAVGGLPLCLAYGDRVFEAFLKGCHDMDEHALTAPARDNIPLIAALINIWNSQFLGYSAKAIIPYSYSLSKLPAHIQQLYMESLGKCVTCEGEFLPAPAGSIVFGEPGSNAQHSFFQLAHQGKGFPIEFIGVLKPGFAGEQHKADHITNHQELWANLMAQARALAMGKESQSPERTFSGNRPSSILVIEDLSPWSIGCLTAYYEAKTVMEGFIMGVNPFDQFGVELGKSIAGEIREYIKDRNQDKMPRHCPDPATEFYLNAVFRGSLS